MNYCIVEGITDVRILTKVFNRVDVAVRIIVSNGFPSLPAVARTVMSYMEQGDKVMIVCDQDNFVDGRYGRDMLGFLLRGAMNNPSFALFTFDPNIDYLVVKPGNDRRWKKNSKVIDQMVEDNMESILKDETIIKIIKFLKE